MKRKIVVALLSLTMLGSVASQFAMTASAASPIVAFPGAEGAGKYATGGRGGTGDNGANIQTWGDASQKNQKFKFIKESDGSYGILTRVSELKSCLDVSGVSKENGANVC